MSMRVVRHEMPDEKETPESENYCPRTSGSADTGIPYAIPSQSYMQNVSSRSCRSEICLACPEEVPIAKSYALFA